MPYPAFMQRRQAEQIAAARLRATAERVTPARVRVLAALLRRGEAASHHELERDLAADAIDRVTLYRVLDWLVGQGLAHRISSADRTWRFTAADRRHDTHAHFHCNRCGRVLCLDELKTPRLPAAMPRGFQAEGMEVTVTGVCAGCA